MKRRTAPKLDVPAEIARGLVTGVFTGALAGFASGLLGIGDGGTFPNSGMGDTGMGDRRNVPQLGSSVTKIHGENLYPNPQHRHKEFRLLRVGPELLPQAGDVDVDGAGESIPLYPQTSVLQHLAGEGCRDAALSIVKAQTRARSGFL